MGNIPNNSLVSELFFWCYSWSYLGSGCWRYTWDWCCCWCSRNTYFWIAIWKFVSWLVYLQRFCLVLSSLGSIQLLCCTCLLIANLFLESINLNSDFLC